MLCTIQFLRLPRFFSRSSQARLELIPIPINSAIVVKIEGFTLHHGHVLLHKRLRLVPHHKLRKPLSHLIRPHQSIVQILLEHERLKLLQTHILLALILLSVRTFLEIAFQHLFAFFLELREQKC